MPAAAVRRALLFGLAFSACALALVACGGRGDTPSSATDKAVDAEVLNEILARQTAAVAVYDESLAGLGGRSLALARVFRAQEQEHVDAVLKALRGLKSPAEPSPEPVDTSGLKSERERLVFIYETESATIDEELSAISKLEAAWPRSLLASTVANQAQHLTLLRQALGEGPLASVPVPFENGTAAAPAE